MVARGAMINRLLHTLSGEVKLQESLSCVSYLRRLNAFSEAVWERFLDNTDYALTFAMQELRWKFLQAREEFLQGQIQGVVSPQVTLSVCSRCISVLLRT